MTTAPERSKRRWLDVAVFVAMIAGLAFAVVKASDSVGEVPWPPARTVALALGLITAAMLLSAASWAAILADWGNGLALARGWAYGQIGKYVPGGVVQYARVYVSARDAGVDRSAIAVAMPVHAICAVLAPAGAAALLLGVTATHLGVVLRVLAATLGTCGAAIVLYRPLTAALLNRVSRRWSRVPAATALPSQRSILNAFAFGSASSCCFGAGFAVLVADADLRSVCVTMAAFLVASAVGLLAIPFPSGLGVREAVLTALLLSVAPVADLLSAAITLRVIQIVVDLTLAGVAVSTPRLRRLGSRRTRSG